MTCYLKKMIMYKTVKLKNGNKKLQALFLVITLMCTKLCMSYCSSMPNDLESSDCDLLYKNIDLDISKDTRSIFDRIYEYIQGDDDIVLEEELKQLRNCFNGIHNGELKEILLEELGSALQISMPEFIADTLCKESINKIAIMVARQTLKSVEKKTSIVIGEKTFKDLSELKKIGISKIPIIGQAIKSLDLFYIGYIIYKLFALAKKINKRESMSIEKEIENLENNVESNKESDPWRSYDLCVDFITKYETLISQQIKIIKVIANLQNLINTHISKIRAKDDDSPAAFFLKYILYTRLNPCYLSSKTESTFYEDVKNCLKNIHLELKSEPEKFYKEYNLFFKIFENFYLEKLNEVIEKMNQLYDYFESTWSFDITAITDPLGNLIEKIEWNLYNFYLGGHSHRNIYFEPIEFKKRLDKLKEHFEKLILEIKYLKKDLRLITKLITISININIGDNNKIFKKNKLLFINLTLALIQKLFDFINGTAKVFNYKDYDKILNHDLETHIHEILGYIIERKIDEYIENEYSEEEFLEGEY
ncbi:hypothetical protein DMUE_2981 [Dictyocoela muelleri]|nr:hypothetical protein DMUE_2981 [Dictyocoela muelleri]